MDARADLVLEGGGVKGIALVGAITVLEEHGYVFNRVAGTSAGAIVAALLAAGYNGAELTDAMQHLDYEKFRDRNLLDHFGVVGDAASVLLQQGMCKGAYLHSWLRDLLATKNVRTFGDMKLPDPSSTLLPDQQSRLLVMASDISNGVLRRLPWDYEAFGIDSENVYIADAVRASMSIPFFYTPVRLKTARGDEVWFVDGGMLSNFPITVFDRTDGRQPRWPTFGIKLSARPEASQGVAYHVHGALSLAEAMIGTLTGFYDRMHVSDPSVCARTIFVDTMKVRATDFDIDAATRQRLFDNGRVAAETFLKTWNWDTYLATFR